MSFKSEYQDYLLVGGPLHGEIRSIYKGKPFIRLVDRQSFDTPVSNENMCPPVLAFMDILEYKKEVVIDHLGFILFEAYRWEHDDKGILYYAKCCGVNVGWRTE